MIRLEKFNFEGFPHVCNYLFEKKIYVIHGDYEKHIFTIDSENKGIIYIDDSKIKYRDFIQKHCGKVLKGKNIISNMGIEKNFKIFANRNSENILTFLDDYDLSCYDDEIVEKIYAILRIMYLKKKLCIIEYSDKMNVILNFIKKHGINEKMIIIILDEEMNLSPSNQEFDLQYIKYFQGYISNKIVD